MPDSHTLFHPSENHTDRCDADEAPRRRITQKDQVLDHLQSGRTITEAEAKSEYGIANVSSVIHLLRNAGWNIVTKTLRDEHDRPYPSYRLNAHVETASSTTTIQVPFVDAVTETLLEPVVRKSDVRSVESLAIRLGLDGPEVQIVSTDGDGEGVFYKLSPKHVRYLSLNLKLFEEMDKA